MKRAAVIRREVDRDPEWQALVVGRGPLENARMLFRVTLAALAEHGHSVTMAHVDEIKPKTPRVVRKPS